MLKVQRYYDIHLLKSSHHNCNECLHKEQESKFEIYGSMLCYTNEIYLVLNIVARPISYLFYNIIIIYISVAHAIGSRVNMIM